MRCATCGTENAPDSRFCGGCGARTAPSNVAPTQKISDDAPIAPPTYPSYAAQQPYSGPPGNHGPPAMPPPSIPPTNNSLSAAPQYQSIPPQPSPYAATAANPSIPPNQMFSTSPGGGSIPPNTFQAPPGTGSIPPNSYQAPPGTGSIPPTSRGPTGPVSAEVSPATVQRRASTPHRAAVPAPAPAQPSMSLPKKRGTRWGIALFILAIDLGLAATGAYLLQAGLNS